MAKVQSLHHRDICISIRDQIKYLPIFSQRKDLAISIIKVSTSSIHLSDEKAPPIFLHHPIYYFS